MTTQPDSHDGQQLQPEGEITNDPVLGDVLANYPSDRLRLLIIGGVVYAIVAFLLNVAFLPVDAATASIIVIGAMAVLALLIGWVILHFWNREVVLYQGGFSYREGSRTAFIRYDDVVAIRQRAERMSYFGGLVRRTIHETQIRTTQDELITLNRIYRRMDDLSVRLERQVVDIRLPIIKQDIRRGQRVPFGARVALSPDAIVVDGAVLAWQDYAGYRIGKGLLTILSQQQATWATISLNEVENLPMLILLLKEQAPTIEATTKDQTS